MKSILSELENSLSKNKNQKSINSVQNYLKIFEEISMIDYAFIVENKTTLFITASTGKVANINDT